MINKLAIAALIGRELTDREVTVLEWLNGWEPDTSSIVAKLIQAAYQNGRYHASGCFVCGESEYEKLALFQTKPICKDCVRSIVDNFDKLVKPINS